MRTVPLERRVSGFTEEEMGQAKQRGTFEERKAAAVEREQKRRMAMMEVARRRPSPKHVAFMGMIAAMMQGHNVK